MVQKFKLDPDLPAHDQIRETDFNTSKDKVYIYYHFDKGKIMAKEETFDRQDLVSKAQNQDEMSDKDEVADGQQQKFQIIHKMELECHRDIRNQEKKAEQEHDNHKAFESNIYSCRQTPENTDEIFEKILEKSIYDMARDKMRLGKQKEEEEEEKEKKKDYLEQILEKLNLSNIDVLNPEQALEVKNEALK